MKKIATYLKGLRSGRSRILQTHYKGDGVGVRGKNLGFMDDEKFASAWDKMVQGDHGDHRSNKWFNGRVPDIRWRAHLNCWAAQTALELEGDFV